MNIVITNTRITEDHTKRDISFNRVCSLFPDIERKNITFRLLNNEIIKYDDVDGEYEIKRDIKEGLICHMK